LTGKAISHAIRANFLADAALNIKLCDTMFGASLTSSEHIDSNAKDMPYRDEHEMHTDNGCTVEQKTHARYPDLMEAERFMMG